MAINTVRATVNGTTYDLTYNSSSGAYEATITAPNKSSYNESGGYYDVSVTAYDDYGNSTTVNSADSSFGELLKLYVVEKTAPTITISNPTDSAVIGSNKPTISWKCQDTDSGVNKDSISLYIDDEEVDGTITASLSGNTYTCSYIPTNALSDGLHTLRFECEDNDGNTATKTVSATIDTTPPTLNVASPTDGLKTNVGTVTVSGTTNDITTSPVTLTINGSSATVNSNGAFSKEIALFNGENTITVVATDGAGKQTTVVRTVYYENSAPVISSISIVPNPVDAGKTFVISVEVE